ncbi:ASCH domain-containing protein [Methylopila musalis]|uniref:ASCH domain-containing protein n=1 Tax=Methylopila musalis TaxID=1134781 RepID=A0ABW3Z6X1_9HYPH
MRAVSVAVPSGRWIVTGAATPKARRSAPGLRADEDMLILENHIFENHIFLRSDDEEDTDGRVAALVHGVTVRPSVPADREAACGRVFEHGWLARTSGPCRQASP